MQEYNHGINGGRDEIGEKETGDRQLEGGCRRDGISIVHPPSKHDNLHHNLLFNDAKQGKLYNK